LSNATAGTALILYDWNGDIDQEAWLGVASGFFEQIESAPNAASYIRNGKSSRNLKPSNLAKALKTGPFESCGIEHLLPPFDDNLRFDMYAGFHLGSGRKKNTTFGHLSSEIDASLFAWLIQELDSVFEITYGIAISYPTVLGCVMYAAGLNHDSVDAGAESPKQRHLWTLERADMVLQKRFAPFRHLEGMLRDVYAFNVLTEVHIRRQIDGTELRNWISASEGRGYLDQVTEKVWVWVIPETRLEAVRSDLQRAGMLIIHPPIA
jgi:hypothetical protein